MDEVAVEEESVAGVHLHLDRRNLPHDLAQPLRLHRHLLGLFGVVEAAQLVAGGQDLQAAVFRGASGQVRLWQEVPIGKLLDVARTTNW